VVGTAHGRHLAALARGEDDRTVVPLQEVKSVGHEETFAADLHDHGTAHGHLVRMSDAVGTRLREASLRGRTVTVKVRFGDHSTITRSHTVAAAVDSPRAIGAVAGALLDGVDLGPGVRLLGVSVSGLSRGGTEAHQLSFAEAGPASTGDGGVDPVDVEPSSGRTVGPLGPGSPAVSGQGEGAGQGWEEVEAAVTAIRTRYGHGSVGPATLVGRSGLTVKRRGDMQWGPDAAPDPSSEGSQAPTRGGKET
jgi:DNA polymerase-4